MSGEHLLQLENVTKLFPIGGFFSRAKMTAVNEVSFALEADKPPTTPLRYRLQLTGRP